MGRALRLCGAMVQSLIVAAAVAIAGLLIVPQLLGWEVMTVLSGSMEPTHPTHSVLVVRPVDPAEVEAGDVIAFQRSDTHTPVTHRVVEIERTAEGLAFITKGDANEEQDLEPVPEAALRGRVVVGVPMLGHLLEAVRGRGGFPLLVLVPALFLLVAGVRSIVQGLREPSGDAAATEAAAASDDELAVEGPLHMVGRGGPA